MTSYAIVAADTPFQQSRLTYAIPSHASFIPGQIVEVPLGKRRAPGVIWQLDVALPSNLAPEKIKVLNSFEKSLGQESSWPLQVLAPAQMQLYDWMSRYYHFPLGQLIFDVLPAPMKRPRTKEPLMGHGARLNLNFTEEQQNAITKIMPHLETVLAQKTTIASAPQTTISNFTAPGISTKASSPMIPWLLHGITGSGKTAVYLTLMQRVLQAQKSVLFLLPEINLTPQFLATFAQYLPGPIYAYHSAITASEKFDLWKTLAQPHHPCVIVGVRSAVFLPLQDLGLIIVDEEHDGSFKQEDRCTYHARDVALQRANIEQALIVLGSATPTVSLWYQFQQRAAWRDHYLVLRHRPGQAAYPQITIADLRQSQQDRPSREARSLHSLEITDNVSGKPTSSSPWPFLSQTLAKIGQAVQKGEQVLVLINQLGYARFIQCKACGQKFICPNCSLNLKYFHQRRVLACSYCDFALPVPEECPTCGNLTFMAQGLGTEKVSLTLQEQLPQLRVARFDREELKNFKQISQRLAEFHAGEIDVLVGTQMLAKGHNFKKVNLVVVLGIDHALNFPDFRARERVYQLLAQISGRAGRYGPHSEVVIQTLNRDDQLFTYLKDHSFTGIYEEEIPIRQMAGCPPFGRLVALYLASTQAAAVEQAAAAIAHQARQRAAKLFPQVQVLGPRPGIIEKVANKYRWTILFKSAVPAALHNFLFQLQDQLNFKQVAWKIDVDPYFLN